MRTSFRLLAVAFILAVGSGVAGAHDQSDDAPSAQVDEVVRRQMREQNILPNANSTDEPIISGLPVIRPELLNTP
jgi:hypothetical protein